MRLIVAEERKSRREREENIIGFDLPSELASSSSGSNHGRRCYPGLVFIARHVTSPLITNRTIFPSFFLRLFLISPPSLSLRVDPRLVFSKRVEKFLLPTINVTEIIQYLSSNIYFTYYEFPSIHPISIVSLFTFRSQDFDRREKRE